MKIGRNGFFPRRECLPLCSHTRMKGVHVMLGTILWAIVIILVVLWLLGWLAFHTFSLWPLLSCCITSLSEDAIVASKSVLSLSSIESTDMFVRFPEQVRRTRGSWYTNSSTPSWEVPNKPLLILYARGILHFTFSTSTGIYTKYWGRFQTLKK